MMGPNAALRAALALGAGAAIAGCHAAYDVEVRNRADRPIMARAQSQREGEPPRNICTRLIDPGSRAHMLLQSDGGARMGLEVCDPRRADPSPAPARTELERGKTVLAVHLEPDPGERTGRFRLERPRR